MPPGATISSPAAHPARSGQSNISMRLHALFPAMNAEPSVLQSASSPPSPFPSAAEASEGRFLKVRILTWNMHDSLPKGDLSELLGTVPPYVPAVEILADPSGMPVFPADAKHPYHIVIVLVAGQECPSASGMPMALGAGFKLRDKEREKPNDKDGSEHPPHTELDDVHGIHASGREHAQGSMHSDDPSSPDKANRADDVLVSQDPAKLRRKSHSHHHTIHRAQPWSSMLDEWYCNRAAPTRSTSSLPDMGIDLPEHIARGSDTGSIGMDIIEARRNAGPYELLTKERMMGLYLAIYIHHDVRPLVKGTSKSAVTAGLIGGRVGNKGAVAISMNVAGTTLLFVNAHLAAHEGRNDHRIADLAKIKAELSVDDYLSPDDDRMMAEDITDRFDHTFIFGDLNFRLDVTRLHADWLLSRKEYDKALAFDQLRRTMAGGLAFVGFKEAPIAFPPTFKYDVARRSKRTHSAKSSRTHSKSSLHRHDDHLPQDHEADAGYSTGAGASAGEGTHAHDGDSYSALSSTRASVRSQHSSQSVLPGRRSGDSHSSWAAKVAVTDAKHKLWTANAAHRLKEKCLALLSASHTQSSHRIPRKHSHSSKRRSVATIQNIDHHHRRARDDLPATPRGSDVEAHKATFRMNMSTPELVGRRSADDAGSENAVYDSSHKKRVPSWCDRILWKSTIHEEPEPEETPLQTARSRMTSFWHSISPVRSRKESSSSTLSAILPFHAATANTLRSPTVTDGQVLSAVPNELPLRRTLRPRSVEALPKVRLVRTSMTSTETSGGRASEDGDGHRRTSTSVPLIQSKTLPPIATGYRLPPDQFIASPTASPVSPPVVSPTPFSSRLRDFLPFFHRQGSTDSQWSHEPHRALHHKPGDVVCLEYRSLNDLEMRRLRGRSDHRPVIGSYAIYI